MQHFSKMFWPSLYILSIFSSLLVNSAGAEISGVVVSGEEENIDIDDDEEEQDRGEWKEIWDCAGDEERS